MQSAYNFSIKLTHLREQGQHKMEYKSESLDPSAPPWDRVKKRLDKFTSALLGGADKSQANMDSETQI